ATLRPGPATVTAAILAGGGGAEVTVDVTNDGPAPADLSVPLYGRRHERGIRPRRRTLLGVQRATVDAGATTSLTFRLGLDELGSWASGAPAAVPVTVGVWCTPDTD